ncbi:MAG: hypothetical protein Q8T09_16225 [Candidatus Melainabacteria bacterium]|nr:hypothetical protein [Candidatus Melainabacteria bacterium]
MITQKTISQSLALVVMASIFATQACLASEEILNEFPCNGLENVVDKDNIEFDKNQSADGKGSLRVTVKKPCSITLFEVSKPDIGQARLIYRAKLRPADPKIKTKIIMSLSYSKTNEIISGSTRAGKKLASGWISCSSRRLITKRAQPDVVALKVKFDEPGTVWVDEVTLSKLKVRFFIPIHIAQTRQLKSE